MGKKRFMLTSVATAICLCTTWGIAQAWNASDGAQASDNPGKQMGATVTVQELAGKPAPAKATGSQNAQPAKDVVGKSADGSKDSQSVFAASDAAMQVLDEAPVPFTGTTEPAPQFRGTGCGNTVYDASFPASATGGAVRTAAEPNRRIGDAVLLAGNEREVCGIRIAFFVLASDTTPVTLTLQLWTECPTNGIAGTPGACGTGVGTQIGVDYVVTVPAPTLGRNEVDFVIPALTVPPAFHVLLGSSRANIVWYLGDDANDPTVGASNGAFTYCGRPGTSANSCNFGFTGRTRNNFDMIIFANAGIPTPGACCLPNGSCVSPETFANCLAQSGTFQGSGTDCGSVVCPQPPANDLCANAVPLTIGAAPVTGDTRLAIGDITAINCGTNVGEAGVWYTVVGNGRVLTATTCFPATTYDTRINVYCGNCNCLVCVDGNDDAFPACTPADASSVSWCSANGQTYYVFVNGTGEKGVFQLQVTQGAVCSTPPSCAAPTDCVVAPPPSPVAETEACGADTNGGCGSTPPAFQTILCGQNIRGTASLTLDVNTLTLTRDIDWYQINSLAGPPNPNAPFRFRVTVQAEFDVEVDIVDFGANQDCTSQTTRRSGNGAACTSVVVTSPCLTVDGLFAIVVRPRFTYANIACPPNETNCRFGVNYNLSVVCEDCVNACCATQCPFGCQELTDAACQALGPNWVAGGPGSSCNNPTCQQSTPPDACCKGDTDANGRYSGLDVQGFVNRLVNQDFACGTAEFCRADMNDDGLVSSADAPLLAQRLLVRNQICDPIFACNVPNNCQSPDGNDYGADDFNAIQSSRLNNNGFGTWSADDFRVTNAGTITNVCWWGYYRDLTIPADCSGGDPTDDFRIVYYNADGTNGRPGTVKAGPFLRSAGTMTSFTKRETGNIIGPLSGGRREWEFKGTHAPVSVAANECVWIEITNLGTPPCTWLWEGSIDRNLNSLQSAPLAPTGPNYATAADNGFDLAFCVSGNAMTINPASCIPPTPANDLCANATVVTDGTFNWDNGNAQTDGPDEPDCAGAGNFQRDVWYCYQATCTGTVNVSLCDSATTVDTVVAVYDLGTGSCSSLCGGLPANIACDDDSCGVGGGLTQVFFSGTAGNRYLIRIGGWAGAQGSGTGFIQCLNTACTLDLTGTSPEGEACGSNSNGGCNSTPPAFVNAGIPSAWAGTLNAVGGTRDTDWYRVTVATRSVLTATVRSQLGSIVSIAYLVQSGNNCPAQITLDSIISPAGCTAATARTIVEPGTYAVIVVPPVFTGLNCGGGLENYRLDINAVAVCATLSSAGTVSENETCGVDNNGGCNDTPPVYRTLNCGQIAYGTFWGAAGFRDTDWYQVTVPANGTLTVSLQSRFPANVAVFGGPCENLTDVGNPNTAESFNCSTGTVTSAVNAGTYTIVVTPDTFNLLPCTRGVNEYRLSVTCP